MRLVPRSGRFGKSFLSGRICAGSSVYITFEVFSAGIN
jgi:hypothetical protein